jgi:hypothetical protein
MHKFFKYVVSGAVTAVVVIGIVLIGYRLFLPQKAVAQSGSVPTVTVQDLKKAGFTNPAIQPPTQSKFLPPLTYFTVKESSSNADWQKDGVANIVAVNIFPTAYASAPVTNGTVVLNFSGRISVCGSRTGLYVCVVGPDQTKGQALLNILLSK